MSHKPRPRPFGRAVAALLLVALIVPCIMLCIVAAPASPVASPDFLFAVDKSNAEGVSGTSGALLTVKRDTSLPAGEPLTLAGWLSTDAGIAAYHYIWVPAGGGHAAWQPLTGEQVQIFHRPDLANANVPYPAGHTTAGFQLIIPPPADVADGYYDLYIRAVDQNGAPCDFLALPRLRYGNADRDNGMNRIVNHDRLAEEFAEDPSVLQNGAAIRAEGLYLPDGGMVRLGEMDLSAYDSVVIRYRTASGGPLLAAGERAVLGLKSSDRHPFVTEEREGYDLTDTVAYSLPTDADGWLTMDLSARSDAGEIWLTGSLPAEILLTEIRFVYNGNGTDRVAAKIHLSEALLGNRFAGQNAVDLSGVRDPLLGDVLRIEVSQDTNDPYVHFYAEQVLDEAGIRLSADNYKYMVVLARAMPHNAGRHMTFYLCAGNVTSATGESTNSILLQNDGEWHYYLMDLTQSNLWEGVIHGWRFDIINGNCHAGDAVEYASVQFFRTKEAAEQAAARPVSQATPYHIGDPVVYLDMVEEQNGSGELSPEETYVVTDPIETSPESRPETGTDITPETPAETPSETLPASPTDTEPANETATESSPETSAETPAGCGSFLVTTPLVLPFFAVFPLCKFSRKRRDPPNGET